MSSEIKQWELYKLEKGQWIGSFPYGYRVEVPKRSGKYNTPGEVFISAEGSLVTDIFLRYSQGNISVRALQNYIKDHHQVSLNASKIHRILINAFYKGIMTWKGKEFPHNYHKLTTPEIFDLCQLVRKNNYRDGLYVPSTNSFKKNPVRNNNNMSTNDLIEKFRPVLEKLSKE